MTPVLRLTLLLLGLLATAPAVAQLRILGADYGAYGRACDATHAVVDRCQGARECEVVASNHLCGDPFDGERKTLTIHYRCPNGEFFAEAPEHHAVRLQCAPGARSARHEARRIARSHGLFIEYADYVAGRRACDATPALRQACNGGSSCSVPVDNYLCGDPFRGKRKRLEVSYVCAGRRFSETVREGHIAHISCR